MYLASFVCLYQNTFSTLYDPNTKLPLYVCPSVIKLNLMNRNTDKQIVYNEAAITAKIDLIDIIKM